MLPANTFIWKEVDAPPAKDLELIGTKDKLKVFASCARRDMSEKCSSLSVALDVPGMYKLVSSALDLNSFRYEGTIHILRDG